MVRRLPSTEELPVFEASARHLSFRLAAEELNVTPAATSTLRFSDFGEQPFPKGHDLWPSEGSLRPDEIVCKIERYPGCKRTDQPSRSDIVCRELAETANGHVTEGGGRAAVPFPCRCLAVSTLVANIIADMQAGPAFGS